MTDKTLSLGERILLATRLAVEEHLLQSVKENMQGEHRSGSAEPVWTRSRMTLCRSLAAARSLPGAPRGSPKERLHDLRPVPLGHGRPGEYVPPGRHCQ